MRITNDSILTAGGGQRGNNTRGATVAQMALVRWGAGSVHGRAAPAAAATNNILTAQVLAALVNATINGALATNGVATLDVPRSLQMVSSNAGDTTQVVTVRGFDEYGEALTETRTLNGTTIVNFLKAFKTITQVVSATLSAGNVTMGTSTRLGLPFRMRVGDLVTAKADNAVDVPGTITVADTAVPTAATGDIRGTLIFNTAPNGTVIFSALQWISDNGQDVFGGENGQFKA